MVSRRPPRGLPPGAPGASMASSAGGEAGCCHRRTGWSGCARPTGFHPVPACKIRGAAERLGAEAPDLESDAWQQTEHQPEPAIEESPGLHQLVHQRLRTTVDVLGPEPEDEARPRTTLYAVRGLHPTTNQMATSHVPSAAQYPRRGDGRKGAYRRRNAMAPAPPLPPSPRRVQRPGPRNGPGVGTDSAKLNDKKFVPSTCPTGQTPTVFHGYSRSAETAAQRLCPAQVM